MAGGELIVVSGPPGAGKSTLARRLVDRRSPSVLVEGDAVFGFLRKGFIDPWLPESHQQNDVVTRAAAATAGRFASSGYWTVYDGVVGPWYVDQFLTATEVGSLHYVVLLPSTAMCVERVEGRRGHGFTDLDATRRMHAQFAAADLNSRHVLTGDLDDTDAFADSVVGAVSRGTFRVDLVGDAASIARRCAALPVRDERSAEKIIGYDEHGVPQSSG